ncbi:uncharacterized protein LOC116182796 [Photinus pyralis]|uniref:uncharacterized protein LOC116182796 n=1 Tax=Photinus pyralis TaxID=7054 RepID=UPI0012670F11|nr:uncharacterized protein LOC116182796 [Photinus pyralis]
MSINASVLYNAVKMSGNTCFLCRLKKGNILPFNPATITNVSRMLRFRKKKKYKYHDINIPDIGQQNVGYHPECKAKFMVLKKKYKDEFEEILKMDEKFAASTPKHQEEALFSLNVSTISSDADERVEDTLAFSLPNDSDSPRQNCVFCGTVQKRSGARLVKARPCSSQSTIDSIKKLQRIWITKNYFNN